MKLEDMVVGAKYRVLGTQCGSNYKGDIVEYVHPALLSIDGQDRGMFRNPRVAHLTCARLDLVEPVEGPVTNQSRLRRVI